MAHHDDQTGLEQTLTERLAALPVPIRIVHHKPEHGARYQWKTLLDFSRRLRHLCRRGDPGDHLSARAAGTHRYPSALHARDGCDPWGMPPPDAQSSANAGPLFVPGRGICWLESMDAYDLIVKSRSMELSWNAYLEDGHGPDPAGIYLFGSDAGAYRGFDVELEEAYPPQRGTIHILREEN